MKALHPEIAYVLVGGFYLAMSVLHLILFIYNRQRKANLVYSLGLSVACINFIFVPISVEPTYSETSEKFNILLSTISNGALLYFISYYVIALTISRYKRRIRAFGYLYSAGFACLIVTYSSDDIFYSIDTILRSSLYLVVGISCVVGIVRKVPNFYLIVTATLLLVVTDAVVSDIFEIWGKGNYPPGRMVIMTIGYTTPFITYSAYLSKDLALTGKKLMKLLEDQNLELERNVLERTREISAQKEELEAQSEKIRELDKMKTLFFSNISHEFRTPLTLIMSPVKKRLSEASDPTDIREFNIIYQNAKRLLQLVNQLLDLSKLESGSVVLRASTQDLVGILKPSVEAFQSLAEVKMVRMTFDGHDSRIPVYIDEEKIEKAVNNLLSNAFKFTPEGGEVSVRVRSLPANARFKDGLAEISITDNGIGIPEEHLPKIFERFYQVDASQSQRFEGTGIGLSIAKEFIDLHQGEIDVESELGKGTCFTIRIPLGKGNPEATAVTQANPDRDLKLTPTETPAMELQSETKDLRPSETILVVEDNVDLRYYIRANLMPDFRIIEADDGEKGIAQALDAIPDLIITDIVMPRANGIELCRKLKADDRTSHIPIIILTSKGKSDSRLEGLSTGADDYIQKPFDMKELLARVRNLIENRKRLREKFSSQILLRPKDTAVQSVDEKFLSRVLASVEDHIGDVQFSVDEFAREVGMSTAQLYRKLNALTGYTPNDFIRHMRLQRAADLMNGKAGNVAEVAYQAGFNNLSYFAKCFRDKFGKSPSEYLRSVT